MKRGTFILIAILFVFILLYSYPKPAESAELCSSFSVEDCPSPDCRVETGDVSDGGLGCGGVQKEQTCVSTFCLAPQQGFVPFGVPLLTMGANFLYENIPTNWKFDVMKNTIILKRDEEIIPTIRSSASNNQCEFYTLRYKREQKSVDLQIPRENEKAQWNPSTERYECIYKINRKMVEEVVGVIEGDYGSAIQLCENFDVSVSGQSCDPTKTCHITINSGQSETYAFTVEKDGCGNKVVKLANGGNPIPNEKINEIESQFIQECTAKYASQPKIERTTGREAGCYQKCEELSRDLCNSAERRDCEWISTGGVWGCGPIGGYCQRRTCQRGYSNPIIYKTILDSSGRKTINLRFDTSNPEEIIVTDNEFVLDRRKEFTKARKMISKSRCGLYITAYGENQDLGGIDLEKCVRESQERGFPRYIQLDSLDTQPLSDAYSTDTEMNVVEMDCFACAAGSFESCRDYYVAPYVTQPSIDLVSYIFTYGIDSCGAGHLKILRDPIVSHITREDASQIVNILNQLASPQAQSLFQQCLENIDIPIYTYCDQLTENEPKCGNNEVEGDEECDGNDFGDNPTDCSAYNEALSKELTGQITCTNCRLDSSTCEEIDPICKGIFGSSSSPRQMDSSVKYRVDVTIDTHDPVYGRQDFDGRVNIYLKLDDFKYGELPKKVEYELISEGHAAIFEGIYVGSMQKIAQDAPKTWSLLKNNEGDGIVGTGIVYTLEQDGLNVGTIYSTDPSIYDVVNPIANSRKRRHWIKSTLKIKIQKTNGNYEVWLSQRLTDITRNDLLNINKEKTIQLSTQNAEALITELIERVASHKDTTTSISTNNPVPDGEEVREMIAQGTFNEDSEIPQKEFGAFHTDGTYDKKISILQKMLNYLIEYLQKCMESMGDQTALNIDDFNMPFSGSFA